MDTVDKMQGQESQTVIVSYGVSDPETALREGEFLYSLNRLNVAITRARAKYLVFLPRPLLEPSLDLLQNEAAAQGLGFMQALVEYGRAGGQTAVFPLAQREAPAHTRLLGSVSYTHLDVYKRQGSQRTQHQATQRHSTEWTAASSRHG